MTSWLILLGCWTIPGALVVTWYHADRYLARRAAAKRLAEAEVAFWTSLATSPDREDGASDPQCLFCRRPEHEHRDRNGHGFAPDREDGARAQCASSHDGHPCGVCDREDGAS